LVIVFACFTASIEALALITITDQDRESNQAGVKRTSKLTCLARRGLRLKAVSNWALFPPSEY
jgi:hypothetical protein